MEEKKWTRQCPQCNKEIQYKNKYTFKKSDVDNKICGFCSRQKTGLKNTGQIRDEAFKKNLSEKMTNHPSLLNNTERNKKISDTLKGRDISFRWENHVIKTITCINCKKITNSQKHRVQHHFCTRKCQNQYYFTQGKWTPRFNPKACDEIDKYGKENGFNFQHALNGGEFYIKELGYWVDGYDANKNTVIEYYEKLHLKEKNIKKDKERMEKIIKFLECKFIIIYYNQKIEYYE
jgi:hypothetical protein